MPNPRSRRYRSRYRHRPLWWPIDPPFAYGRSLEAYRLHSGKNLADFAALLGLAERRYLTLVTTYPTLPTPLAHHIARRLKVPPGLIYECVASGRVPLPTLRERESARLSAGSGVSKLSLSRLSAPLYGGDRHGV